MTKDYAIIVAGGSGIRMKTVVPKQFINLNGKPVLMHSIQAFHLAYPEMEIIVVLPENQREFWNELCVNHKFGIAHQLINGGDTRFQSVKNGLSLVHNENGVVAIHDGVRPLVSLSTIKAAVEMAREKGSGVPASKVKESIRSLKGVESSAEDRDRYMLVQTPQCFKSSLIKKAYECEFDRRFTDDASVAEYSGVAIYLTEGNAENIKITEPSDIALAEALLKGINEGLN